MTRRCSTRDRNSGSSTAEEKHPPPKRERRSAGTEAASRIKNKVINYIQPKTARQATRGIATLDAGLPMTPEITLIKKRGPNPVMSKRIFLDEHGTLKSDGSQCLMVEGIATRAPAETASALAMHIMSCGSDQAIALGALNAELPNRVTITVPSKMKANPSDAKINSCVDFLAG